MQAENLWDLRSPSKLFKCEFCPLAHIVYWTHICNNDIDRNSDSSDMWSNYCVLTCWCFWCPPPLITLSNYTGLSSWWYAKVRLAISKWEHAMHHRINQNTFIIQHFLWNLNLRKLNKTFKIKKKKIGSIYISRAKSNTLIDTTCFMMNCLSECLVLYQISSTIIQLFRITILSKFKKNPTPEWVDLFSREGYFPTWLLFQSY